VLFVSLQRNQVMVMKIRRKTKRFVNVMLIVAMVATMMVPLAMPSNAASMPKLQATANVRAQKGAVIRKTATAKGKALKKVKKNAKLIVYNEVFETKNKTNAKYRWYYVASGKTKGYIRSDMIKNIKYTQKKAKTTDELFYRVGVGKAQKRKGMFKKGAQINVVLPAYRKGSKERWYKVKVGKAYYYSCATWITFTNVETPKTQSNTKKTQSNAGNSNSNVNANTSKQSTQKAITSDELSITVSGETIPANIGKGCPFALRGKVKSTDEIKSAAVAIDKTNGTNVVRVRRDVGSKVFDISSVDSEIKFGTLEAGTYKYRVKVNVGGTGYLIINSTFKVIGSKRAQLITNKAFELAWPVGTPDKKLDYGPGKATAAFTKAINQVYPYRSNWGTAPRAGASCDVFVGTTIRASGADTEMPRGLSEQFPYFKKSKRWKKIAYNGNLDTLRSGDVIFLERKNGGSHIFIYLTKNSKRYIAEAGYKQFYGRVAGGSYVSSALKPTSKRKFTVYRIVD